MRQANAELARLFADLSAGIAADLNRAADADGVIPRAATYDLQRRTNERVIALFFGRGRAGQLAPFETLANGRVMPLAPYTRVLWAAIAAATRLPVAQNAAMLARALPAGVLAVMSQATEDPFAAARAEVAELEVFRPNVLAKYEAPHTWVDPNGYRLSDRVWNTSAHARQQIDMFLEAGIREGKGALQMSRELERFLRPDRVNLKTSAPYGRTASYDAMRLARTEITRAHTEAQRVAGAMNPFVQGLQWVLSPSHPKPDICDEYARGGPNGDGIYSLETVPSVPHPACLCYRLNAIVDNPQAVIDELHAEIRRQRQRLTNKIGPVQMDRFERLLLGEELPPRAVTVTPAVTPPAVVTPPAPDDLRYRPAEEQLARVHKKVDQWLQILADSYETTPAEIERIIAQRMEKVLADSPMAANFYSRNVDALLQDGRFKSQFETRSSGGILNLASRANAEELGLGIPENAPARNRPIYGFLRPNRDADAIGYGDITFVFKEEAKRRATYTVHDSLYNFAGGEVAGTPITNPGKASWDGWVEALHSYARDEYDIADLLGRIKYFEVQIQGGVSLGDVAAVIDRQSQLSVAQRQALQARGIEIRDR